MLRPSLFLALLASSALAENPATTPVPRDRPEKLERHELINAISKQGGVDLVFLGDSITEGWEKNGAELWETHFAPLKAANFGIGGDRTEHVLWRMENGNFDGIEPKLVVLMIGTNNTGHSGRNGYESTPEQTIEGVEQILQELETRVPTAKVLLLAIFPRGETAEDPKRVANEKINAGIEGLADGDRVHWLNLNDRFLQDDGSLSREIMPDLLHLSPQGYQIWAEAILPTVAGLMAE